MNPATFLAKHLMPWRFALFLLVFPLAAGLLVGRVGWSEGLLGGFDIAALLFVATLVPLFRQSPEEMRRTAKDNDANRALLLVISFLVTVVIMAAIVVELADSDRLDALDKGLIAASLALVWLFGNAVYMLHYAHLYYSPDGGGGDCGGLDFPKCNEPRLSDFAYFAYTLGVAVQTSDVQVTSRRLRQIVAVHCVVGFFFNLGVLALTVNVLGSR